MNYENEIKKIDEHFDSISAEQMLENLQLCGYKENSIVCDYQTSDNFYYAIKEYYSKEDSIEGLENKFTGIAA